MVVRRVSASDTLCLCGYCTYDICLHNGGSNLNVVEECACIRSGSPVLADVSRAAGWRVEAFGFFDVGWTASGSFRAALELNRRD